MKEATWDVRRRSADVSRRGAGRLGRATVATLTRAIGAPRLAAWSVASTDDRRTTLALVTEELTPLDSVTPSEIVGNYLRGYVLMGRGGESRPEPIFRYLHPRAIIDLDHAHIPSRVRSYVRHSDLEVRDDAPLLPVIRGCQDRAKTWIVEPVVAAWEELERAGFVTTYSAFRDGKLVGGLWGIEVGRTFGIMSMFHHEDCAGAIVMASLLAELGGRWDLLDCGSLNANFARYGAHAIASDEFRARVLDGLR